MSESLNSERRGINDMLTKQRYTRLEVSESNSGLAYLLLAREGKLGRFNPLSLEMLREITACARWLASEEAQFIKVVIIQGAQYHHGGSFTVGADLASISDSPDASGNKFITEGVQIGADMADAVEAIPAVTVCSIRGHCVGGGAVLASACDIRVACEQTMFSIPELHLG